jgi:hypothetical protein
MIAAAWMPQVLARQSLDAQQVARKDLIADLDALRPSKVRGERMEPTDVPSRSKSQLMEALQDALLSLEQSSAQGTTNRLHDLMLALEHTASGHAPLPASALCLADRGLPKLRGAMDVKRRDVAAAQSALAEVCQHAADYVDSTQADVRDPMMAASVNTEKNLGPFDWLCARVGIRTPDISGVNPFYELDGYALSVNSPLATLEEGQRFAVKASCPPKLTAGVTTSYGARISLTYTPGNGGVPKTVVLDSFAADGESVGFPADFYPSNFPTQGNPVTLNATLKYQTVRRECQLGCSYTALGLENSRSIGVKRLGEMCNIGLRYKQFAINDRLFVNDEFLSNYVNDFNVNGAFEDWNWEFHSYARTSSVDLSVFPPMLVSSFPAYTSITGNDYFAVHRDDELNIHDPDITRSQYISSVGTTVLSGLRFPRVIGSNFTNGEPFSYSCKPPKIVRDFVAFCTTIGKPNDSLYVLPYRGKTLTVQGNNGQISHNNDLNRYAWDFETEFASYKGIYAARAGQVIDVVENNSGNCSGCDNNWIKVRHQDGSEAHYLHGQQWGADVETGDFVRRGQLLGQSGNVGNSAIRHIHFSAHSGVTGNSIRSSFDDQSEPCVVPSGPFDTKESTLTPGQDKALKYLSFPNLGMPDKR